MKTIFLGATIALLAAACSSSSTTSSSTAGDAGTTSSGVVAGPKDTHCSAAVTVDPATCSGPADAGTADMDGGMPMEHGATLFNDEGDDDDCKYHVKWSATSIAQNADVTFKVELTTKADGKWDANAKVRVEAFLDDTHPAPNTDQKVTETSPGTYSVGPVRFDAAGRWTVRFHFHGDCEDGESSPHGHGAFYVQVP